MTRRAQEILKAAVRLPEKERVQVVEELLVSLEPPMDKEVDAAWAAEIERRSREISAGTVRPIPWKEVRAKARRRIRAKA